jgi:hypothetical protein
MKVSYNDKATDYTTPQFDFDYYERVGNGFVT